MSAYIHGIKALRSLYEKHGVITAELWAEATNRSVRSASGELRGYVGSGWLVKDVMAYGPKGQTAISTVRPAKIATTRFLSQGRARFQGMGARDRATPGSQAARSGYVQRMPHPAPLPPSRGRELWYCLRDREDPRKERK